MGNGKHKYRLLSEVPQRNMHRTILQQTEWGHFFTQNKKHPSAALNEQLPEHAHLFRRNAGHSRTYIEADNTSLGRL